jgi:hypothetical protein
LPVQSATVAVSRSITAAAGVFAPGHLGELTQYLPFELVDDVLEQTKTTQRRLRRLLHTQRTTVNTLTITATVLTTRHCIAWRSRRRP